MKALRANYFADILELLQKSALVRITCTSLDNYQSRRIDPIEAADILRHTKVELLVQGTNGITRFVMADNWIILAYESKAVAVRSLTAWERAKCFPEDAAILPKVPDTEFVPLKKTRRVALLQSCDVL